MTFSFQKGLKNASQVICLIIFKKFYFSKKHGTTKLNQIKLSKYWKKKIKWYKIVLKKSLKRYRSNYLIENKGNAPHSIMHLIMSWKNRKWWEGKETNIESRKVITDDLRKSTRY